ncbi:MAG: amidophosphoribosyltransferase [Lachnospiraceae bacterium]|nr:amidophosphoribosyltransferase [Lachnospiraceae bacterium]
MQQINEECGIFGIRTVPAKPLAHTVAAGLTALQHRGQEAAGIAINKDRTIRYHKGLGLVHEVFSAERLNDLGEGNIAVGHVRYSTSGANTVSNAQPMVVKHIKGQLAVCHNGNLTNSYELRSRLELEGCIFHTTSDTEVISYLITRKRLVASSIEDAVRLAMQDIRGAFSLILMSPAKLIACRDRFGIRPLCYGETASGDVVFASESCALDAVGAKLIRELDPGEMMVADEDGVRSIPCFPERKKDALCVFEYIYFARPDSIIRGCSVHEARRRSGAYLAADHPVDADVVIGVPDSGLDAALGFSGESGIPYGIGLIKNKYIGRTFIAPTQDTRDSMVRLKLGVVSSAVKDKRVVLIDDSIVRGTTSSYIVSLIREAGAREVHLRISSPPFLHPCYYGTDVDSAGSLIACGHSVEDVARITGADSLAFLSVERALSLCPGYSPDSYCAACFNGSYPDLIPTVANKDRFDDITPGQIP